MRILGALCIGSIWLAIAVGGYLAITEPTHERQPVSATAAEHSPDVKPAGERLPPTAMPREVPKAVMEQSEYDFGIQSVHTDGSYVFHLRNDGNAPLHARFHRALESTWHFEIQEPFLEPGSSTPVSVRWTTGNLAEDINQSALLLTNDPDRPQIEIRVRGKVRAELVCQPSSLSVPDVRPHQSTTVETLVHSHLWKAFELRDLTCTIPKVELASFPATAEQLLEQKATAGWWVRATFPPGLNNGRFQGEIHCTAVPGDSTIPARKITVPMAGRVLRRLSVYGEKIEFTGVVNLGLVRLGEGGSVRLMMKVRDEVLDLPVKRVEVQPDFLQTRVSRAPSSGPDDAGTYFLEIGVPASAPECYYTNTNQDGLGTVRLEFDHPRIPDLDLKVYFTVERRVR